MFFCSELGNGATSEAGKHLSRAANVFWRCAQYFVITSCGYMHRYNRCMYMVHVCMSVVVVVRLPRPMEGNGVTPIFRFFQNCQFHHMRLGVVGRI